MSRGGKVCIELNFARGGEARSRKAKIKSFWEFIDARSDLAPVQTASEGESITECKNVEDPKKSDSRSVDESTTESNSQEDNPDSRRIWHEEFLHFKKLGLDRVALAASDTCKRCVRDERNNVEKEPVFADCVPQSYDELATDMEQFQDRVRLQKPQCSYKEPGKFHHLVQ